MLVSLEIRNFLLIKQNSVNFTKGFNAFTGETGAGKSIIMDGLKLALGGKNYSNLNLKENEITSIKAVFEIDKKIKEKIIKLNLSIDDDYLIVERQINHKQKSKILINGQIQPLNIIKQLLSDNIEFQENYEQQELFESKYFLKFIDKLGVIAKDDLKKSFLLFKDSKVEYQNLIENSKNIKEKLEILISKKNKFDALRPKENEYSGLLEKRNYAKNFKKINDLSIELKTSIELLQKNNDLIYIDKNLIKLSEFDKQYLGLSNKFSSNYFEIIEIINEIELKFENFEFNDVDFNSIDERIYQYQQLSKFFDTSPENLHQTEEKIINEINQLQNFDKQKDKLFKIYQKNLEDYLEEAKKVSSIRNSQAGKVSSEINMMLPSMNIEQGEILFEFLKTEEEMFTQDGYDILKVSFRTNKKSEFNSIKKVASGGELSRLLLIIKSISAKFDKNLTLIFDEVDSGLSGKIADNVSKKIYELSKNNQIIAITHSAQVASKADSHWKIEKKIKNDDMQSNISLLDDQGRILEIASLISGTNVTDETKIVAQNLINHKNES
ncbi:AAA family ATPase [Alphaproteobacteria bacterium]|nr:AAA family ATPase [Alphaproteobacteria bacterium]